MEDTTIISKLLFCWVTPLMEKGVKGPLNHSDDLFDLPDQISTNTISHKIDQRLHNMVTRRHNSSQFIYDILLKYILITFDKCFVN